MKEAFAKTPAPPYYAVIFTSRRNDGDSGDGYAETADRMVERAGTMPGFLGIESARDSEGFGITVSYWADEASIRAWKAEADHGEAQTRGKATWYEHYELRVAKVERAYGGPEGR